MTLLDMAVYDSTLAGADYKAHKTHETATGTYRLSAFVTLCGLTLGLVRSAVCHPVSLTEGGGGTTTTTPTLTPPPKNPCPTYSGPTTRERS